jgi:hypothetical protein
MPAGNFAGRERTLCVAMEFYAAEIVAVDADTATARFESSGKEIKFRHRDFNAIPADMRIVGARGYISFPKAPPVFTRERADEHQSAA